MIGTHGAVGAHAGEMGRRMRQARHAPASSGVVAKAIAYVRAEVSRIVRPMRGAEVEARLSSCRSCERLVPAPPGTDRLGWCDACGCGTRKRAELSVKATMRDATCPLRRW